MADRTSISWSDSTWNPFSGTVAPWMCVQVSPGCTYCYASRMNMRYGGPAYPAPGQPPADAARLDIRKLIVPLSWEKPRRVFVHSMTDTFGEWVQTPWLDKLFAVMALAGRHQFQVLTKRPTAMRAYMVDPQTPVRVFEEIERFRPLMGDAKFDRLRADLVVASLRAGSNTFPKYWPLPNIWLGVSIETDAFAWRASLLADTPAAVRFISAEPLLGPLTNLCDHLARAGNAVFQWLIVGGESGGPLERRLVEPCPHPTAGAIDSCVLCYGTRWKPIMEKLGWVRELRDCAIDNEIAFHFKQFGGQVPYTSRAAERGVTSHRIVDGQEWNEFPVPGSPGVILDEELAHI